MTRQPLAAAVTSQIPPWPFRPGGATVRVRRAAPSRGSRGGGCAQVARRTAIPEKGTGRRRGGRVKACSSQWALSAGYDRSAIAVSLTMKSKYVGTSASCD